MAISFACTCGKRMQAKDELAGKRIKCSACQKVVKIPASGSPPAAGDLVSVPCACGKRVKVKAELAGKKIKCPGCQSLVVVPGKVAPKVNGKPTTVSKTKLPEKLATATKAISSPGEKTALPPNAKVARTARTQIPAKSMPKKNISPSKRPPVMTSKEEPEPTPFVPPFESPKPEPYRPPTTSNREVDDDGDDGSPRKPWGPIIGIVVAVIGLSIGAWYFLSPNTGTVSGTVTLDGKALGGAEISFVNEDGKSGPLVSGTHDDGQYVLTGPTSAGVPTGNYKVIISKTVSKNGAAPANDGEESPMSETPVELVNVLAEEYCDPLKTKLRAVVSRGNNAIHFPLKSSP